MVDGKPLPSLSGGSPPTPPTWQRHRSILPRGRLTKQLDHVDLQNASDLFEDANRRIGDPALDAAHIGPINAGVGCQGPRRNPPADANSPNIPGNELAGIH